MAQEKTAANQDATEPPHPSFMFAMGELSGQVRMLTSEIATWREDQQREMTKMKDRLDTQETWRNRTIGACAAITLIINLAPIAWKAFHG